MTKVINPQDYSYSFRLGMYDCFKVLTGKCSLELSEEEYKYFRPFTSTYKDGSLDYCREFAQYLIRNDLFKQDTGITMFKNECGHVSFSDGQHRTCIAKKIGINNLTVSRFEINQGICRVCHFENEYNQLSPMKKLWYKIITNKEEEAIHKEFIDDELSGSFLKEKNI